jgi:hypothetical protein
MEGFDFDNHCQLWEIRNLHWTAEIKHFGPIMESAKMIKAILGVF